MRLEVGIVSLNKLCYLQYVSLLRTNGQGSVRSKAELIVEIIPDMMRSLGRESGAADYASFSSQSRLCFM